MTNPPPMHIGMLIYPGVTLLDFIGPLTALGATEKVHLVSKTLDPVLSDSGVAVVPTATLETCPSELDVLFVPGGFGTAEVMEDPDCLRFLAERGQRAKYVTAVCSGSLILAAAGLLNGYRATTHWSSYDVLSALGVEVSEERVAIDRNRITGGGVTAGIDFGLVLLARLRGDTIAKMSQLAMEYDPAPPFDAGRPQKAGPEATAMARSFVAQVHARTLSIAERRVPAKA